MDTSALMAILLDEADAERCIAALEADPEVLISAGTLAEAMIVADRRNVGGELRTLVTELGLEVVAVSSPAASGVAEAYARWGKGVHAAGLNFGDCFAYALAHERNTPLLCVGDHFRRTDLRQA